MSSPGASATVRALLGMAALIVPVLTVPLAAGLVVPSALGVPVCTTEPADLETAADGVCIAPDGETFVEDPTGTGGLVTASMAALVEQTRPRFPGTGWSCWSPRPGQASDHPIGRACDVTFGNRIGEVPSAEGVAVGWAMAGWLQVHAEQLGVQYLIWQGLIWDVDRADEGWRPYDGGGMHDPTSVTGAHIDHLHISVRP